MGFFLAQARSILSTMCTEWLILILSVRNDGLEINRIIKALKISNPCQGRYFLVRLYPWSFTEKGQ